MPLGLLSSNIPHFSRLSRLQPAASLAGTAKASGAFVVEVNPTSTAQSELADVALRGPAAEILPQLL